jgi:hypothetical protein
MTVTQESGPCSQEPIKEATKEETQRREGQDKLTANVYGALCMCELISPHNPAGWHCSYPHFFFFLWCWELNQGLTLTRQVLCPWATAPTT